MRPSSSSSTAPERWSGGAANAKPCSSWRTSISPAAHSCTTRSACLGVPPPTVSQAWQVPSVGWPANGSSRTGVKMRTR